MKEDRRHRPLTEREVDALKVGGFDFDCTLTPEQMSAINAKEKLKELIADAKSVDEAAVLLGLSSADVIKLIQDRSLYAVFAESGFRLLSYQFTEEGLLPKIESVNQAIPEDMHPVAVYGYFSNPDPDLEIDGIAVAPLEWLRSGQEANVVVNKVREL